MRRDYFYHLQSHNRPVNDLSTAVKLNNRLLRFWADGGFVSLPADVLRGSSRVRVTKPLRRSAREAKGSFYTAISRKVVGESARDNPERYCGSVLSSLFFKEI